jgi:hypothetical protein
MDAGPMAPATGGPEGLLLGDGQSAPGEICSSLMPFGIILEYILSVTIWIRTMTVLHTCMQHVGNYMNCDRTAKAITHGTTFIVQQLIDAAHVLWMHMWLTKVNAKYYAGGQVEGRWAQAGAATSCGQTRTKKLGSVCAW